MRKNPTQPETTLSLGGLNYSLVFDFEAIADAEDLTGRALLTGLHAKDITAPTISLVRLMLYACLHAKQSKLTLDDVKALVTRKNIVEVWGKVLECWTAGMAEPEEDAVDADPTTDQS
jgi:hypothetical protein